MYTGDSKLCPSEIKLRLYLSGFARAVFVCFSSLDVLADLPLQAVASLLQLLNGTVLGELVGSAAHLALCHAASEQLLHGCKNHTSVN